MRVFLGLGSNVGDRRAHLRQAIELLRQRGFPLRRVSPLVETPALLPDNAPHAWNRPFLNTVIEGELDQPAQLWRAHAKAIQHQLGRDTEQSGWAPRPIDIDILIWGDQVLDDGNILVPDPELANRDFVLVPLMHLQPSMTIPENGQISLFQLSERLSSRPPLWMGIVNVTPDSFSDGGRYTEWDAIEPLLDAMIQAGVHIIDVGAESTRPGAEPLSADAEWLRLQPVLHRLLAKLADDPVRPRISIDTYHAETAAHALQLGVDLINDVGGLADPAMLELARGSDCEWVAMHQLGIPADRKNTLPSSGDPLAAVEQWLLQSIERWQRAGLNLDRIIADPGIGFGKDGLQSLRLLREVGTLRRHGLRLLVGHSRKSFLRDFSTLDTADKDWLTVGASLALCAQGVDILRVHDVAAHANTYRGWSHLQRPGASAPVDITLG